MMTRQQLGSSGSGAGGCWSAQPWQHCKRTTLIMCTRRLCRPVNSFTHKHTHTAIRDFPSLGLPAPDMVLALHACDTATDDALALGVTAGARIIMSVPCCQKDIQRQYQWQQRKQQGSFHNGSDGSGPDKQQQQQAIVQQVFEPLMDHGILKQRQLDLLTDTFRAQLLRLAGYRCATVFLRGCCLRLTMSAPELR